ncbi:MAG: response regulator [Bdellovibrionia bacterium]
MAQTQSNPNPSTRSPSIQQPPLNVFILEDDRDLIPVFRRVLESIGPQVGLSVACSVDEAIDHLRKTHPTVTSQAGLCPEVSEKPSCGYDLIIADIFLEGESTGLDFWHTCQKLYPGTPVIITSGMPVDQFFSSLGRNTVSPPFLAKPFSLGECKQIFEGILNYRHRESKQRPSELNPH